MINFLQIKKNQNLDLLKLVQILSGYGYERVEVITGPSAFAVSGGTISIFPANLGDPIRVDFFGSEVETISAYDLKTGLRRTKLTEVEIVRNVLKLEAGIIIQPNDYIVHEDYGIGIFRTLGTKNVNSQDRLYIFLEYRNGEFLYVPLESKLKLSPYIGIGRGRPNLSRLGSQTWQKTYKKTYQNVLKMAQELLSLYAARSVSNREPWRIETDWNNETERTFPYINTKDQARAIKETFADLKKDVPMDRLISGDVGFGKTEVAIRAAAQAVANGFQVVMLVPTTILVEQHFVTFKQRFKSLPVTIEHLSRFIKTVDQRRIIQAAAAGQVDILIGTHRLLGEDIAFKNLGLYILDEEQRFGVRQKERVKKLKGEVSVLALSATPIPRTLFMSLSGIRDISRIETPPIGRKEIITRVMKYDEKIIQSYIQREVDRGGQVYYLHNEVSTIESRKRSLQRLMPKIVIKTAHGQMEEGRLAERMRQFAEGQIDLLVCSTIIENGLDLANVNTLIVEEADRFGLSQLYQIRGRIGRSPKQAFALLTYPEKKLTSNASKRLKTLMENSEIGSGYNIALSDLEIRGGGNILGREQHGNMEAVGLVLYSKLLKMAVERIKKNSVSC